VTDDDDESTPDADPDEEPAGGSGAEPRSDAESDAGPDYRQSRLFTDDEGGFDAERAREDALPVEDGAVVDVDALADHQTYVEGRGVYDERNAVNDLTGREWKHATKSVVAESYPPDLQFEARSAHGGQKPPRLCRDLIERFSAAGALVLDPFAGVGGTLLGAALCEHEGTGRREALGFELDERWVEVYREVLTAENAEREARGEPPLSGGELRHGDCLDLVGEVADDAVDLLLTDVPYWNMDRLAQTRNEARTRPSKLGAFNDRGGESKAEWLDGMREAFAAFARVVRPRGYVVVFIGDMYRDGSFEFLGADLARAIRAADDAYVPKANLVWYDPSKELHVYGYPHSFVPSMVHQNVLVFRVEPDRA
jgi:DNA modification methylase